MLKITLAAIAAALLAAGCGGDDDQPESSGAASSGSTDRAAQYSQCMRENGVPEFPDPENGRLQLRGGPNSALNPDSPEFQAAQEACRHLQPQGMQQGGGANPEMEAQVLEYAKCMRSNGVPNFPDPEVSGGGVRMRLPQGVDQSSPQFQQAQQKCGRLLSELGGSP